MARYPWVAIRKARDQLAEKLSTYPNTMGTMLGLRVRKGELCEEPVVTVFVSRKSKTLEKSARIPSRIKVGTRWVATDVIRLRKMGLQDARFPNFPLGIYDGFKPATLTMFCGNDGGIFGLSCGHALIGTDQNPYTPAPVSLFSPPKNSWIPVGPSENLQNSPGPGTPNDYGFVDAGLFRIMDNMLKQSIIQHGKAMPIARAHHGETLAAKTRHGPVIGNVIGFQQLNINGGKTDVIINVAPPGMYPGDSGTLWRNMEGAAVAIHCKGEIMPAGSPNGSAYTAAMHVDRALSRLGVAGIEI